MKRWASLAVSRDWGGLGAMLLVLAVGPGGCTGGQAGDPGVSNVYCEPTSPHPLTPEQEAELQWLFDTAHEAPVFWVVSHNGAWALEQEVVGETAMRLELERLPQSMAEYNECNGAPLWRVRYRITTEDGRSDFEGEAWLEIIAPAESSTGDAGTPRLLPPPVISLSYIDFKPPANHSLVAGDELNAWVNFDWEGRMSGHFIDRRTGRHGNFPDSRAGSLNLPPDQAPEGQVPSPEVVFGALNDWEPELDWATGTTVPIHLRVGTSQSEVLWWRARTEGDDAPAPLVPALSTEVSLLHALDGRELGVNRDTRLVLPTLCEEGTTCVDFWSVLTDTRANFEGLTDGMLATPVVSDLEIELQGLSVGMSGRVQVRFVDGELRRRSLMVNLTTLEGERFSTTATWEAPP